MSFGINGPDNLPAIQKAQNMMNNGGGGNLGYFNPRQKKKNKQDQEDERDVFEFSSKKEDIETIEEELDSVGTKIKQFWMKLHNPFMQENPEVE